MHNSPTALQQVLGEAKNYYWEDAAWINPPFDEYRMIELDISTFTPEGTLPAATRQVSQLKKAGVNAVVICPDAWLVSTADAFFQPAQKLAADKARQLKHFINTCHYEGIAVSIDMASSLSQIKEVTAGYWQTFTENALGWLQDFHIDALRLNDIPKRPEFDGVINRLRDSANWLTTRTGRQYYLLVSCEKSRVSVLGRYVQQVLCRVEKARLVSAGAKITRAGLARLTGPIKEKAYRRDYLYDRRFARALRTFFGRSA